MGEAVDVVYEEVVKTTDDAYLIDFGEGEEVWIPKSVVYQFDPDSAPTVTMSKSFAEQKGLV